MLAKHLIVGKILESHCFLGLCLVVSTPAASKSLSPFNSSIYSSVRCLKQSVCLQLCLLFGPILTLAWQLHHDADEARDDYTAWSSALPIPDVSPSSLWKQTTKHPGFYHYYVVVDLSKIIDKKKRISKLEEMREWIKENRTITLSIDVIDHPAPDDAEPMSDSGGLRRIVGFGTSGNLLQIYTLICLEAPEIPIVGLTDEPGSITVHVSRPLSKKEHDDFKSLMNFLALNPYKIAIVDEGNKPSHFHELILRPAKRYEDPLIREFVQNDESIWLQHRESIYEDSKKITPIREDEKGSSCFVSGCSFPPANVRHLLTMFDVVYYEPPLDGDQSENLWKEFGVTHDCLTSDLLGQIEGPN